MDCFGVKKYISERMNISGVCTELPLQREQKHYFGTRGLCGLTINSGRGATLKYLQNSCKSQKKLNGHLLGRKASQLLYYLERHGWGQNQEIQALETIYVHLKLMKGLKIQDG